MSLLIMMARDLPLKKPLPEPEVALWKYYRWVDWARAHGLYADYDCPRTRFLKVNGLLKLSYAPHLLDVQSTESITLGFIEEQVKSATGAPPPKDDEEYHRKKEKKTKEQIKLAITAAQLAAQQVKEELREWIQFTAIQTLVNFIYVIYYPSLFNFTSAGSNPPIRNTKSTHRTTDVQAPKYAPLYFQLDGPETNKLRISLSMLHPRVLANCGTPVLDFIEPANFVLERFEWFKDCELPKPKAYVRTRGYEAVEIDFQPGRHFFRIWTHSRMNWSIMALSESTVLLNTRDVVQAAAVKECPWASKFLLNLGSSFSNWIKVNRASQSIILSDREFFRSYQPDLDWDIEVTGYDRHLLHWMFRQALQSLLSKTLNHTEWKTVSNVLRKYFCDPDFGFPPKPKPPRSVREIANLDVCDCLMPEIEETEFGEEQMVEMEQAIEEVKPLVTPEMMAKLLKAPELPITSHVCELATDEVPCGILKDEREKMIRKHEAAIVLQAHWRGTWARKCLKSNVNISTEVTKYVNDHAFGTIDALSRLMNEFFRMFPGAKYAYSVSSALSGVYGLQHHTGTTQVTPKCKWVPYFQGVFYCHAPVKVHFDVLSSIPHSTVAVYNNDSGQQLPQAYNAHITFEFAPNFLGYTLLGHGNLPQQPGIHYDAHWQLTVMTSIDGAFHICDNEDPCKEMAIPHSNKLHLDEIFLPNRRNILGGIQISVVKHESISFRAAATSPDLEMLAILRAVNPGGTTEEISKCSGRGEIYWPYIRLDPPPSKKGMSTSHHVMSGRDINITSARSLYKTQGQKHHKISPAAKARSALKMKSTNVEPKLYSIEVECPMGWPLTLAQWRRVDEVRNSQEAAKLELQTQKKGNKEKEKPAKPGSAKDKDKLIPSSVYVHQPLPGDASVELECALALGGGAYAKRDDERDIEYSDARKAWDAKEPGRNHRGSQISSVSLLCFMIQVLEMSVEMEEEALYLLMPDQLRDRFTPLHFLPYCTKERTEHDSIVITPDMAEAAKNNRNARIEAAIERMRELQLFNEEHVLGRQKYRCQVLEKLFVDSTLCPELVEVMEQREEAIAQEVLNRNLSATKKKMEAKKK
uniref:Globin domain-containing protein n=1 Tax=Heliothis virescens TaxID=7102 RepID=A0A2A4JLS0_HELVI